MIQKQVYVVNHPIKAVMTKGQFDKWVDEQLFVKYVTKENFINIAKKIIHIFNAFKGLDTQCFMLTIGLSNPIEIHVLYAILHILEDKIHSENQICANLFFSPPLKYEILLNNTQLRSTY